MGCEGLCALVPAVVPGRACTVPRLCLDWRLGGGTTASEDLGCHSAYVPSGQAHKFAAFIKAAPASPCNCTPPRRPPLSELSAGTSPLPAPSCLGAPPIDAPHLLPHPLSTWFSSQTSLTSSTCPPPIPTALGQASSPVQRGLSTPSHHSLCPWGPLHWPSDPSPPPIPRPALLGCSIWGPRCPLLTVPQGESVLPSSTGSASRTQVPDCPSEVPSLSQLLSGSLLVPGPHLCPLLWAPPQLPWLTDHGCRKRPFWQPPLNRVRPKLSLQVNTMLL